MVFSLKHYVGLYLSQGEIAITDKDIDEAVKHYNTPIHILVSRLIQQNTDAATLSLLFTPYPPLYCFCVCFHIGND